MITTERTKIRMLSAVSGLAMPEYGVHQEFAHAQGDTLTLHPQLAAAWIACGHAEAAGVATALPVKEEKKAK